MPANSSKPDANTISQLSSLAIAVQWLDREGSSSRPGHLLKTLVASTQDALQRGESPPEKDSASLADIWRLEMASPQATGAPALRSGVVTSWWDARQQSLLQRLQDGGAEWLPTLDVLKGGGRSLPTRYRIRFEPLPAASPAEPETESSGDASADSLTYRIDPAKPALWLRVLLGSKPFPIASWRGYILLGTAALNFTLIALLWWAHYLQWSAPRPVTTAAVTSLIVTVILSAFFWWQTTPLRQLPQRRVTLAGVTYLAMSELYGQLRTMPDSTGKDRRRIFSVVRHWGTCPVCAAEVDLDDGRRAFPDRLVGRCHDAPLEHVFSFDPVTLKGGRLRQA